jgi:signal transduction histidine kinase
MTLKFYNRLIKPVSTDSDLAEREIVLNYLLVGMVALSIVAFIVTLLGPLLSGAPFHPVRLVGMALTTVFIISLYIVARYLRLHTAVAVFLTLLVAAFGCLVAAQWSLWDPHSVLLLSLAVVMAGVLIGARYSLYLTGGLTVVLLYLQHGQRNGQLHPDLSWLQDRPAPGDVIGFAAILLVIALVSWLFNRQMELSLRRARRSEKALQRQKILLEIKAEKRAQQLAAAQLDKMQELYRFAELGRLSTALFHDLANHLSTVSLDIEGLGAKDQTDITRRISQNIGHIDTIVQRVRQQLRGKSSVEVFNVRDEIDEVVKILQPAAEQAGVTAKVETDRSVKPALSYKGDVIRFRQIILNLILNGIEAYPTEQSGQHSSREVIVTLSRQRSMLHISVSDHGLGVAAADRDKIFRPFYTTKQKGTGIGLFIVQQVVEHDFGGRLELAGDQQTTIFKVSLPKSYYAAKTKR